jgi:uncharacterized protein YjiS (DUF1127 family)
MPVILEATSMSTSMSTLRTAPATRRVAAAVSATAAQLQNHQVAAHRVPSQLRAQLIDAWQLISLWRQRSRDRAALRSLSPRDIRDFCPRQAEAEEEMNKPFWRA